MSNTIRWTNPMTRSAMLAAPRQVWLATLGAAAVTRQWAGKEAGTAFRTLVKEGSAAESHAIRYLGNRAETSVSAARAFARDARKGVDASVAALARVAAQVGRNLPSIWTRIDVAAASAKRPRSTKTAGRTQRATRKSATSVRAAKARTKK